MNVLIVILFACLVGLLLGLVISIYTFPNRDLDSGKVNSILIQFNENQSKVNITLYSKISWVIIRFGVAVVEDINEVEQLQNQVTLKKVYGNS